MSVQIGFYTSWKALQSQFGMREQSQFLQLHGLSPSPLYILQVIEIPNH